MREASSSGPEARVPASGLLPICSTHHRSAQNFKLFLGIFFFFFWMRETWKEFRMFASVSLEPDKSAHFGEIYLCSQTLN